MADLILWICDFNCRELQINLVLWFSRTWKAFQFSSQKLLKPSFAKFYRKPQFRNIFLFFIQLEFETRIDLMVVNWDRLFRMVVVTCWTGWKLGNVARPSWENLDQKLRLNSVFVSFKIINIWFFVLFAVSNSWNWQIQSTLRV